jgi:hypothetical protein
MDKLELTPAASPASDSESDSGSDKLECYHNGGHASHGARATQNSTNSLELRPLRLATSRLGLGGNLNSVPVSEAHWRSLITPATGTGSDSVNSNSDTITSCSYYIMAAAMPRATGEKSTYGPDTGSFSNSSALPTVTNLVPRTLPALPE